MAKKEEEKKPNPTAIEEIDEVEEKAEEFDDAFEDNEGGSKEGYKDEEEDLDIEID